jgi:hypothetical protein
MTSCVSFTIAVPCIESSVHKVGTLLPFADAAPAFARNYRALPMLDVRAGQKSVHIESNYDKFRFPGKYQAQSRGEFPFYVINTLNIFSPRGSRLDAVLDVVLDANIYNVTKRTT